MDEPKFLSLDEVLYLHEEAISRFGGSRGIGDLGLIESALGAARNTFWYGRGDVFDTAATYAFHIAESQAFVDGNKRTAVAAAAAFLKLNGVRFPEDDGTMYNAMIEIANKRLDKPGLAGVLRRLTGARK
jgi:death on curing protein